MTPYTHRSRPRQPRHALLSLGKVLVLGGLMTPLSGCQLGYLLKQGKQELQIVWGAEDLEELRSEGVSETGLERNKREKLDLIVEIKSYAAETIGLEVGDAYSTYYDTGEQPISYIISAAHPLALIPYRWSFPFVGQVTYKGFFDREDALAEEKRLRQEGWDTHMGAVAAFSTLGWFKDPVLSTMLNNSEGDLVELIIHELVHRTIYFKDNTAINESMATVIGRAGARHFLEQRFGAESAELERYLNDLDIHQLRTKTFRRLRQDLDALYRSPLSTTAKHARKAQIFKTASRALGELDATNGIRIDSNAYVLARGQYNTLIPLFEDLLDSFSGRLDLLMAFLKSIPVSTDPLPIIYAHLGEHGSEHTDISTTVRDMGK